MIWEQHPCVDSVKFTKYAIAYLVGLCIVGLLFGVEIMAWTYIFTLSISICLFVAYIYSIYLYTLYTEKRYQDLAKNIIFIIMMIISCLVVIYAYLYPEQVNKALEPIFNFLSIPFIVWLLDITIKILLIIVILIGILLWILIE